MLRHEAFELIQYQPTTEQVRELPLLFVPPTINRFYVLDLAPGRSMIEYLVAQGQQVFAISWRNPDAEQGHFDLDTYAEAVLEARDAVAEITGRESVHLNAACSGGIIAAGALAHLAETDRSSDVASLTLMVCALDNARAGTPSAFINREVAAAAVAESARKGYLDGKALAGVFAWLRPNDLIWSYVINNYLLGKEPPAFDVLYWNQDSVRLAAGLHRDFIRMALDNSMTKPGGLSVLGTARRPGQGRPRHVRRRRLERPHRPVGQRLPEHPAARRRFPVRAVDQWPHPGPDQPGGARLALELPGRGREPGGCRELDRRVRPSDQGSWWPDYVEWLQARSGELVDAPGRLGSRRHKATGKAPGSYVHAS